MAVKKNKKSKVLKTKKQKSVSSGKTETKPEPKHGVSEAKGTAVKQPNPIKGNKPFPKGVSGNPNGRPRKLVGTIIDEMKANGVTPLKQSQVIDAYEMLFQLTIPELTAHVNEPNTPIFVRIIGKAMLSGKGPEMLEKMLDRAHGKAKTSGEIKMHIDAPDEIDYTQLSDAALKEVLNAKRKQSGS